MTLYRNPSWNPRFVNFGAFYPLAAYEVFKIWSYRLFWYAFCGAWNDRQNLKTKSGFRFGNFAILANRKSRFVQINLIRKFRFQNLRILKKARQNRFKTNSAKPRKASSTKSLKASTSRRTIKFRRNNQNLSKQSNFTETCKSRRAKEKFCRANLAEPKKSSN